MTRRGLLIFFSAASMLLAALPAGGRTTDVPYADSTTARAGLDSDACGVNLRTANPPGRSRDRSELSRRQVAAMIADFDRSLRTRFGVTGERELLSHRRVAKRLEIPVYFHVIAARDQGRLSRLGVNQQITALNNAYGGVGSGANTEVVFRLRGFDVTNNAGWFRQPHRYERPMKKALRKGGPGTLNLYTASVGSEVLGYSTFPQWYKKRPKMDGVVVDYRSVPGGQLRHFNRGFTAVHEIGHWLGLFHTFENGCRHPGDAVDDTPYEALPTEGCPLIKDTCATPGSDPLHNYMDYGYDDCMHEFTRDQGRRIHSMWAVYRD